ncbi:TPA: hypothetical protein N2G30_002186 [Salmonella enterica]|nr:hypothetical protein [Salmonella enterica]
MAKKTANAPYFDLILLNRAGIDRNIVFRRQATLTKKTALALFLHHHRQLKQFATFFSQVQTLP